MRSLAFRTWAVGSGGYINNDDGGTMVDVAMVAPCFAAGSRITTAVGDVAVECLAPGDRVQTHFAGVVAIKWVDVVTSIAGAIRSPRRYGPCGLGSLHLGTEGRFVTCGCRPITLYSSMMC
jgi:hypothetical protein